MIHAQSFAEPWDEHLIEYFLGLPSSLAFLDEREGGISAFVLCRLICDESEVLTFAVAPAWRRRGIGRQLIESAQRAIRGLGGKRLFLEVAEDAPATRALYQGAGFHVVGCRHGYYRRAAGEAVNALVMCCDL